MKSAYENYFKSSIENLQKSHPFKEIYVKYLKKNNIYIYIYIYIYLYVSFIAALLSFHY